MPARRYSQIREWLGDAPGAAVIGAFMEENEKILKGVETFEESNVPPGGVAEISSPPDQNVDVDGGGSGFPDGLEQTNIKDLGQGDAISTMNQPRW